MNWKRDKKSEAFGYIFFILLTQPNRNRLIWFYSDLDSVWFSFRKNGNTSNRTDRCSSLLISKQCQLALLEGGVEQNFYPTPISRAPCPFWYPTKPSFLNLIVTSIISLHRLLTHQPTLGTPLISPHFLSPYATSLSVYRTFTTTPLRHQRCALSLPHWN